MTMNKLLALADRVEKLTGPDREVDAEIAACLRIGTEHKWAFNYPEWEGRADGRVYLEKGGPSFAALAYTASLDAAMTLVPTGWGYGLDYAPSGSGLRFTLGSPDLEPVFVHGDAMTFPRAIVVASLRARAHGGGEG